MPILITGNLDADRQRVLNILAAMVDPTWIKVYQNPVVYQAGWWYSWDVVDSWIAEQYDRVGTKRQNGRYVRKESVGV